VTVVPGITADPALALMPPMLLVFLLAVTARPLGRNGQAKYTLP
jgi:hypothetical protein